MNIIILLAVWSACTNFHSVMASLTRQDEASGMREWGEAVRGGPVVSRVRLQGHSRHTESLEKGHLLKAVSVNEVTGKTQDHGRNPPASAY